MKSFKTDATVLFCDIRNFTTLFEQKDPIEAAEFANEVLAVLGNTIENHGGVVDRFTGDGFLAHFGAFSEVNDHAAVACESVINLRKSLNQINNKRYLSERLVLNIGVGIHTGEVAVANITTGNTTQLTVLGDTVNTASRIESLTRYFSVDALVSKSTFKLAETSWQFQKMPLKKLKGIKRDVHTYWLLPMN